MCPQSLLRTWPLFLLYFKKGLRLWYTAKHAGYWIMMLSKVFIITCHFNKGFISFMFCPSKLQQCLITPPVFSLWSQLSFSLCWRAALNCEIWLHERILLVFYARVWSCLMFFSCAEYLKHSYCMRDCYGHVTITAFS